MLILALVTLLQGATAEPEVPCSEVVTWMEKHAAKKFIYSETVGINHKRIRCKLEDLDTKSAYAVGLALLRTVHLVVIHKENAKVTEIVSSHQAAKRELPVFRSVEELPAADEWCTLILRVKFANPRNLQVILFQLSSSPMCVFSNVAPPTLVMTDYSSNLRKLAKIIQAMDYPHKPLPREVNAKMGDDWLIRKFLDTKAKPLNKEERDLATSLIEKLSSDSISEREAAFKGLRDLGPVLRSLLPPLMKSDDAEVRLQARKLLFDWAKEWTLR